MASTRRTLVVIAGLFLTASAPAQNITTLIESGAVISGIGNVATIRGGVVDNAGHVLVLVWTDNPAQRDVLVDENGVVLGSTGQALALPPGATIQDFGVGNMSISSVGRPAFHLTLQGTPGPDYDRGLYYDLPPTKVTQEMDLTSAPQLPAGSLMKNFYYPKINALDQIFVRATVDDPTIVGLFDTTALFILDPIAATETVIAKTGDILPGQTQGVSAFGAGQNGLAFNDAGHALYRVITTDNAPVSENIYLDYVKLAQSGSPSPFGGSYGGWGAVALNNLDDYAFYTQEAGAGGGEGGLVSNGAPFVHFGDSLPDIEPSQLGFLGTPLFLGDDGRIVWSGNFADPSGSNATGIFVDYSLLVSTGATSIHGSLVQSIPSLATSFSISSSGQYLVFQATLASGVSGSYLIDLWQ